jgi:hypothetical protein
VVEGHSLRAVARELIDSALALQADDGSWPYGSCNNGRRLGNVDFHQGFVIDSLLDIAPLVGEPAGRQRIEDAYRRGLDFLAQKQITPEGAFRWRYPRLYPIDVHNQAQGIISLSRAPGDRYERLLETVLHYTLAHFWSERRGYFAYQKRRCGTNTIPYMRWSQGWMGYALSEYLKRKCGA